MTDISVRQVQVNTPTVEEINAALLLLCQWINEIAGIGTELPPGLNMPAWVAGTTNEITVTDDGDGTVTLSTPQQIAVTSSPTFAGLTLSGLTASQLVSLTAGNVLTTTDPAAYQDTSEKDAADGYAGLDSVSRTTKGVDTTDDLIVDLATSGLVLKDTQATPHYWRVTVETDGSLTTTDVGTGKP